MTKMRFSEFACTENGIRFTALLLPFPTVPVPAPSISFPEFLEGIGAALSGLSIGDGFPRRRVHEEFGCFDQRGQLLLSYNVGHHLFVARNGSRAPVLDFTHEARKLALSFLNAVPPVHEEKP